MSTIDLRLCGHIIGQHFGDSNKKVCLTLASKGPLTCAQIAQAARLPARTIRECLFVLIHHNLVKWSSSMDELGVQQQPTVYHLDAGMVILRLAYPVFVTIAHRRHGEKVAEAMLEIIKSGRCPKDLLDSKSCDTLLSDGLIEVVTASASRIVKDSEEISVSAAASPGSKRKAAATSASASPSKAKKVRFEAEENGGKVFVRLSITALLNALWYEQLVSHASRRVNEAAGSILGTILQLSGQTASTARTLLNNFQISHKLPSDISMLVDNDVAAGMTRGKSGSQLSQYLEVMAQDLSYFIKAGEQAGGQYYLDFPASLLLLQTDALLAFVTAKFGQPSARLLRILLKKKFLEERAVAKIAMLSGKEARERLFILMSHGLVHLQEVPKTADHAPSRTIYLWTVPMDRIRFNFADKMKKTLVNILERVQHEKSKYRLLIAKTERSDVAANPAALLTSLERAQLEALTQVMARLEFQVTRIISDYILFAHLK